MGHVPGGRQSWALVMLPEPPRGWRSGGAWGKRNGLIQQTNAMNCTPWRAGGTQLVAGVLQDVPGAHRLPAAGTHGAELALQDAAVGCEGAAWPSCWGAVRHAGSVCGQRGPAQRPCSRDQRGRGGRRDGPQRGVDRWGEGARHLPSGRNSQHGGHGPRPGWAGVLGGPDPHGGGSREDFSSRVTVRAVLPAETR